MWNLNPFSRITKKVRRVTRPFRTTKSYQKPRRSRAQSSSRTNIKNALSGDAISEIIQDLPNVKVRRVIDGDTVIILQGRNEVSIRLDSIDCPEDGQPWGDTAKYGLIKLIGGQHVHIEEHGVESHGRTLATIYVMNKQKNEWMNVNERMVTLGHAWVMRRFYNHLPKDRQDKLNSLERWSKSKKIGLWGTENLIPPWEWRNGK